MKATILGNPHLKGLWDKCMADPILESPIQYTISSGGNHHD